MYLKVQWANWQSRLSQKQNFCGFESHLDYGVKMSSSNDKIYELISAMIADANSNEDLIKLSHFYTYISNALLLGAEHDAAGQPEEFMKFFKEHLERQTVVQQG